jgi:hypothetical protein
MTTTASVEISQVPKGRLWGGWTLTVLVGLFLLFDAAGKLTMPIFVVDAFNRLGIPAGIGVAIGVILTVCTVIYLIPRTAVLGAVLLTGYLGGAIAIHMRAGSTLFEMTFPALFGILAWIGIYLREPRLGTVMPFRRR